MYNYELSHHGVKGMKWGIRRFQNKDGSLTQAGKNRRTKDDGGGKVYTYTLGPKNGVTGGYVTSIGTTYKPGIHSVGNITGRGSTKKESKRDAERNLISYLNQKNDPQYESASTRRLRNKVQKQTKKEYEKAVSTNKFFNDMYDKAVISRGRNSVEAMQFLTLASITKDDIIATGKAYTDSLLK